MEQKSRFLYFYVCGSKTPGAVCVHTGVDLPMSLQGFLRLELGTTLVTDYGLLTSCTKTKKQERGGLLFIHKLNR